jgi:hypothetical protein
MIGLLICIFRFKQSINKLLMYQTLKHLKVCLFLCFVIACIMVLTGVARLQ